MEGASPRAVVRAQPTKPWSQQGRGIGLPTKADGKAICVHYYT